MALLAASERFVQKWTKDARAYERAQQQAWVWDLWLNCLSQQEIADTTGIHQTTVGEWIKEKRTCADFLNPPDSRQHFDIWSFQTADGEK